MKEIQPHAQYNERDENGNIKNPKRREFIRGIIAGVAGAATVAGVQILGNKYIEKEKELNRLVTTFEGKQEDFSYAVNAMNSLIAEMQAENLSKVKISGTGSSHEKIDFLRDFITQHLTSKVSSKYPQSVKETIFKNGFYTVDSLAELAMIANSVIQIPDIKINGKRNEEQQPKKKPFVKMT